MTVIEKFARDKMGITLTPMQVQIIESWTWPRNKKFAIPRLAGQTTAMKVLHAWIKYGLEEL